MTTDTGNVTLDEWIVSFRSTTRYVADGWVVRYYSYPDGLTYYDLAGEKPLSFRHKRCWTDDDLRQFFGGGRHRGSVLQGKSS